MPSFWGESGGIDKLTGAKIQKCVKILYSCLEVCIKVFPVDVPHRPRSYGWPHAHRLPFRTCKTRRFLGRSPSCNGFMPQRRENGEQPKKKRAGVQKGGVLFVEGMEKKKRGMDGHERVVFYTETSKLHQVKSKLAS